MPQPKKKLQKRDALVGGSHVGPMCDLHLFSQGHSVHVPIIPGLGWLKWKSGWCQWLSHFVYLDARCLFHGICFLFGFNVTCRFLWFHTKRSIHISLLWISLLSIFPFFPPLCFWAAIQEICPNLELLLFPHKVDNQVHWSQFHPVRKFSLFAVFQGHSCSVAIARW